MALKDVSAKLSTDGSMELVHKETGEVIQRLLVQDATNDHRSFILATWVKSYRHQARKDGYEDIYNELEPKVAEDRWGDCLVVTDEDGYTIYAWVCANNGGLYHVYVIPTLRGVGVCRELLKNVFGESEVQLARKWPGRHVPGRVNPYLLGKKNG